MSIAYLIGTLVISLLVFFNRNKAFNYGLVTLFSILQWVFTVYIYYHRGIDQTGYFNADALAILLLVTISIIAVPAFYHSYIYFKNHKDEPRERSLYYASMIILVGAISAAYLSNHIAVTWIFVEVTTLAATGLIYHRRNIRSLEGTWKYIFVCSISLTFVFIGILFLSLALQQEGHTGLTFPELLSRAGSLNVFWLKLAFIFIFTGYTAKLGLVPMYTAGIDAKDKAPSPAGALFSSVLMNMGFVGIFRFYEVTAVTAIHAWTNHIIMIAAGLSIFVATIYMLKVKNIKRMFAYSSIEHMGIVMLGVAAGGVGYYAAILHLLLHAFAKSSMFFQMGQIYRIYNSKSIYDSGSYFKYNLTGTLVLLLGFFCVTAIPPSGLFVSEFMVFLSLFNGHYIFVLILVLILLTMIIWAFGKNMFRLLFTPAVGFREDEVKVVPAYESISQFILLGLVIYLGFNPPEQMVDLINEAVKNLDP